MCIPMMLADYSTCCIPFQTMKPSRGTVGHLLIPHEITQKNPIKPDQPWKNIHEISPCWTVTWQCVKTLYPCSSHQNSWVKMVLRGIDPYPHVHSLLFQYHDFMVGGQWQWRALASWSDTSADEDQSSRAFTSVKWPFPMKGNIGKPLGWTKMC